MLGQHPVDMIAQLTGLVVDKRVDSAVVDVGGVGYKVFLSLQSMAALPPIGGRTTLRIHTQVREDAIQLYGFVEAVEEEIFHALITVNGVGPKLAMNMLSGLPAEELAHAIVREDLSRLVKVPGVGKKTAERLVVELKDKLGKAPALAGKAPAPASDDVVGALVNLGYKRDVAERAAREARQRAPSGADVGALIREALRALA